MDNNNRFTVSQTLFRNRKGVLGIDFRSPFGVLVCALAVFVFALVSLVIVHFSLKADHERAVRTYRENNWLKTTAQADGTTLVTGKSSGTSYQLRTTVLFPASQFPVFPSAEWITKTHAMQCLTR